MANGVVIGNLRERARYWRRRADAEPDPRKQAVYRETAAILDRTADELSREQGKSPGGTQL